MPRSTKWGIAFVVAIILSIIGAVSGNGGSSNDTTGAGTACRDYVKQLLKAPDTARWDGDYTSTQSDGRVVNTGLVSSENGFGALIQSSYTCTLSGSASDGWTVVDGSVD